jgi:hypothetical protein
MEVRKMTAQKQPTKNGTGTVEKKKEAVSKKGDKYWKFVIDGLMYFLWDYEIGVDINVGSQIQAEWYETNGQGRNGPVTYRNLTNLVKIETTEETVEQANPSPKVEANLKPGESYNTSQPQQNQAVKDFKEQDADKYDLGMAKNNAAIIFAKLLDKVDSVEEAKQLITDEGEYYEQLVKAMFNKGKKIRQEILGY